MLKELARSLMVVTLAGVMVGCQDNAKVESISEEIEQVDLVAGQGPQETVKVFFATAKSRKLDKAIACLADDAVIGGKKAVAELNAEKQLVDLLNATAWTPAQAKDFIAMLKTRVAKLPDDCMELETALAGSDAVKAIEKFLKLQTVADLRKELGKAVAGTQLEIANETINGDTAEVKAVETIGGRATTSLYKLKQNADKIWIIVSQEDIKEEAKEEKK